MSVADKLGLGPTRESVPNDDGSWTVKVTPPDWVGGKTVTVRLTADQHKRYKTWISGLVLIQDALPDVSCADRELLMHGLDL